MKKTFGAIVPFLILWADKHPLKGVTPALFGYKEQGIPWEKSDTY